MSERKILPLFSYKNYVELKLCLALYEEVVGPTKQFTSIGDLDFINMLNLRPTLAQPAIRHREKSRVCFLISKLSLLIDDDAARETWKRELLATLDITQRFYHSHYCDVASDGATRENIDFRDNLQGVFESLDFPFR